MIAKSKQFKQRPLNRWELRRLRAEQRRQRFVAMGKASARKREERSQAQEVGPRPPLPGEPLEVWIRIDCMANTVDQYNVFQGKHQNQRDVLVNGQRWERNWSITRIFEKFRKWSVRRWLVED